MLADLILAVITRRLRADFLDVGGYDDTLNRADYNIRTALIHAVDPLDYERRFLAGRAVKAQARQTGTERRARKVVAIHRSKRA